MFFVWQLSPNRPATPKETADILRYVDAFAATPEGAWLRKIDYRKKKFFWCDAMRRDPDITGCWSCLIPGKIFLRPSPNPGNAFWHEDIAADVIQELRNAWQFKYLGPLYYLLVLPRIRKLTIEAAAAKVTEEADNFCREMAKADAIRRYKRRIVC